MSKEYKLSNVFFFSFWIFFPFRFLHFYFSAPQKIHTLPERQFCWFFMLLQCQYWCWHRHPCRCTTSKNVIRYFSQTAGKFCALLLLLVLLLLPSVTTKGVTAVVEEKQNTESRKSNNLHQALRFPCCPNRSNRTVKWSFHAFFFVLLTKRKIFYENLYIGCKSRDCILTTRKRTPLQHSWLRWMNWFFRGSRICCHFYAQRIVNRIDFLWF